MDATGDFIGIYGTHGNKSDTWITEWISVDIMYTPTTNSEEDLEEFTWDYSAEVKDKDCIRLEDASASY